jgi:hypothetical protein
VATRDSGLLKNIKGYRIHFFRAPRRKKLVLTQQVEPESGNGRLDAAAIPQAETSSASGATPSVYGQLNSV